MEISVAPIPEYLYSLDDESICAELYSINGEGYAILNVSDMTLSEYSLVEQSYYKGVNGKKYYAGIFRYYVKSGSEICSLPDGIILSDNQRSCLASTYREDYPEISETQKMNVVQTYNRRNRAESRAANATSSNNLPYTLPVPDNLTISNGHCGPTAAATMIWYYGAHVSSSYKASHPNMSSLIVELINKIEPTSLSSLRNGCNDYFTEHVISNVAYSCSYSFSRVMNCIDAGKPITIGGDASAFDPQNSGGHVGVVHGYSRTTNPSNTYYVLKVNDGWGRNNVSIAYYNTAPSTLADHVYFAN